MAFLAGGIARWKVGKMKRWKGQGLSSLPELYLEVLAHEGWESRLEWRFEAR